MFAERVGESMLVLHLPDKKEYKLNFVVRALSPPLFRAAAGPATLRRDHRIAKIASRRCAAPHRSVACPATAENCTHLWPPCPQESKERDMFCAKLVDLCKECKINGGEQLQEVMFDPTKHTSFEDGDGKESFTFRVKATSGNGQFVSRRSQCAARGERGALHKGARREAREGEAGRRRGPAGEGSSRKCDSPK